VSACLSPENADFYDQMFATLARRRIPDSYELNVNVVDAGTMRNRASLYWGPDSTLPVAPQKEITIHYTQKTDAPRTGCRRFHLVGDTDVFHILDVADDNGTARLVVGCVGGQSLQRFRSKADEEAAAATRARASLTQIAPELKNRLTAFIKAGQTVSAIQTYQAELKQSTSDAVRVVDMLCDEL
jgi:hypothetical protein